MKKKKLMMMFLLQKIKICHFKSLSKNFLIKGVATIFVVLLPFSIFYKPNIVFAFSSNSAIPGDSDWNVPNYNVSLNKEDYEYYPYSIQPEFSNKEEWWYSDYNKVPSVTHYEGVQFSVSDEYLDSLPPQLKLNDGRYCVPIVLSGKLGAQVYPNAVVKNVLINKGDKISLAVMGTYPGKYFEICQLVNGQYVNNDNTYYYSIDGIYLPKTAKAEGFEPQYNINNLNEYPIDTINIITPKKDSNIKTNNGYFDVVVKGKIKIDFSESLLGNTLFPMTSKWIGDYIRRDFRYSVVGDVENENNLTYLGVGNKNFSNYLIEYLNQFYQDVNLNVDKEKVGDVNTNWTIGVSGNMNDWSKKHYYNFIINTRLWCGYLNKDLKYNLSFTVPVAFSGGLTDVNPSEYKTISINNYSLTRGFYSDDNFDGIDDTSLEAIPNDEIEIIHPGFVFPSTSTPSNNNFNDGDVVQNNNNNNNILINNGSEVSEEEKNGILNMLDNGVRKTTTLLSNLKNSITNLGNTLQGLFDLLPEPVSYLFYSALCLSLIFFILSLRR